MTLACEKCGCEREVHLPRVHGEYDRDDLLKAGAGMLERGGQAG